MKTKVKTKVKTYTKAEIFAIMDKILEQSDDFLKDEWYSTEYYFTEHGLSKLKEVLNEIEQTDGGT